MPSNFTANYQLNQWVKDDQVRMEDFNADNAKIDAALAGLAGGKADVSALTALTARVGVLEPLTFDRVAHGTYEGDSSMEPRTIPLPWEPKLLILMGCVNNNNAIAFLTPDACIYSSGMHYSFAGDTYGPAINGSSFVLKYWFNIGTSYYLAIR